MQILSRVKEQDNLTVLSKIPKSILCSLNKPCILKFEKGSGLGVCLNCAEKYCIKYRLEEIDSGTVNSFPIETNNDVCPVGAIFWDEKKKKIIINQKKCFKCGLCISRCPVGAVYFDGTVKINYLETKDIIKLEHNESNLKKHLDYLYKCRKLKKKGTFIKESEELLLSIYKKMPTLNYFQQNQFVRNLLIQVGIRCSLSRVGDVYTRMDAVFNDSGRNFGVAEIEFGKDTLESARALLDDIAVLHVRYKMNKEKIIPLLVCLQLPNFRQGYWQVVKDIKRVEKININTVSVGSLLVLMWNNVYLNLCSTPIYIDYDDCNLRLIIESLLKCKISIKNKYLGIFEPEK